MNDPLIAKKDSKDTGTRETGSAAECLTPIESGNSTNFGGKDGTRSDNTSTSSNTSSEAGESLSIYTLDCALYGTHLPVQPKFVSSFHG